MNHIRSYWLPLAFMATLLAAFLGMSWNSLEPRMSFPMGTKVMLVVAVAAAAISRVGGKSPMLTTIGVLGMAVPCGAFVSVVIQLIKDPTSGNLWPIAVAFLLVLGLIASSVGTLLGSLLLLLLRSVSSGKSDT